MTTEHPKTDHHPRRDPPRPARRPVEPADLPSSDPSSNLPPLWRDLDWRALSCADAVVLVVAAVVAVAVVVVVGWVAWQIIGGAVSSPSSCQGWVDCYG